MIHAMTMPWATPQRTAGRPFRGANADDRAGDGVSGGYRDAEPGRHEQGDGAAVSAQKPCTGVRRVICEPMVWTMRQPPNSVPSAIAGLAGDHHPERHVEFAAEMPLRIEQHGDDAHGLLRVVAAMAERVERGETNCRVRKMRSTANGVRRTNIHDTIRNSSNASTKPISGDSTIAALVLASPPHTIAETPALARPAPTRPPISACEELDGDAATR